jgi:hypothetical protein
MRPQRSAEGRVCHPRHLRHREPASIRLSNSADERGSPPTTPMFSLPVLQLGLSNSAEARGRCATFLVKSKARKVASAQARGGRRHCAGRSEVSRCQTTDAFRSASGTGASRGTEALARWRRAAPRPAVAFLSIIPRRRSVSRIRSLCPGIPRVGWRHHLSRSEAASAALFSRATVCKTAAKASVIFKASCRVVRKCGYFGCS